MVKLQKRFAYKYKNKEHYKHIIVIPENAINKLGWKSGEELDTVIEEEALVVKPIKASLSNSIQKRRRDKG
jgi:bifunctional DNA-binding transcriptional regulator/antitoxin component of YhaV-PrlF toxin-antitoxin module